MVRRFASASRFAALIMVAGALAVACSSTTGSPVISSLSTKPTTSSSSTSETSTTSRTAGTSVDPASFCANTGTIELTYRSGSTPPPYHYEWTLTVEGTKGSLAFRAGYSPDRTTWTESFDMPDGDATKVCAEIVDAVQSSDESQDDSVGGSSGNSTIETSAGTWSRQFASGPSITLQDAMSTGYIPFDAWDAVHQKFQEYQANATN